MPKIKSALPILLIALLAACGKEEAPSAPPAAPAPPQAAAPAPAPAAPAPAVANAAGEGVYKKTCALCHSAGVGGAPRVGDAADWSARAEQGIETLYTHAISGYTGEKGMMPAKGGNTALSDEEVKAAVDFMVASSK